MLLHELKKYREGTGWVYIMVKVMCASWSFKGLCQCQYWYSGRELFRRESQRNFHFNFCWPMICAVILGFRSFGFWIKLYEWRLTEGTLDPRLLLLLGLWIAWLWLDLNRKSTLLSQPIHSFNSFIHYTITRKLIIRGQKFDVLNKCTSNTTFKSLFQPNG